MSSAVGLKRLLPMPITWWLSNLYTTSEGSGFQYFLDSLFFDPDLFPGQ